MYKVLISFFLCFSISYSLEISNSVVPIHKTIQLADNIKDINKAIIEKNNFKEYKYFRRYIRKRHNSNLWLKLNLHNNKNTSIKREIFTRWDNTNISIYLVKNEKIIYFEKLREYKNFLRSKPFVISSKEQVTLYLNIRTNKILDDFYYMYILSPPSAIDFIVYKEKFFHNGLLAGILIAMMMYNFFMYFSMQVKSYLYLGLYQFLIIFYTSDIRKILIVYFEDYPEVSFWLFKIISSVIISVLSILFTREFLNTKKYMPFFDKLLILSIFILGVFQLNSIQHINYAAFLYSLYFFAGSYSFFKGNKAAFFYILGFSPTIVFLMGINIIKYLELNIYFEYQSAIQVLGVIEAFSLSMALYLKVRTLVKEREEALLESQKKEKMLLIQSRFATMGEMIASIAHQWRQPLNHLSIILANLQLAEDSNKLNKEYLDKKVNEGNLQLKYMSNTIEDFTNFFAKKRKLESFSLEEVSRESLELVDSRCKKYKVKVFLQKGSHLMFANYKNELIQVIMIVLNNAIDALILNNIEEKVIIIKLDKNKITIEDNAGGIKEEVMPKIFDPYFSTKDRKFGTGLGLYTAKIIVDNLLKGKIFAKNINNGAAFIIEI